MTHGIGKTVKRVAVAHVLLIGAILGAPFVDGCWRTEVQAVPVSIVMEAPVVETRQVSPPAPVQPAPAEPEPARPDPPPVDPPPVEPPPRKRTPIEVSRKRVTRDPRPTPKPQPARTPSSQDLQKLLSDVPPPSMPSTPAVSATENQRHLALVQRTMYDAWRRPAGEAPVGTTTAVSIRLAEDGSIESSRIVTPSGIAAMDDSVLEAVQSVKRIPGLPASFIRANPSLTIVFELLAGAG